MKLSTWERTPPSRLITRIYAERAAHAIAEKRADRHVRRLHKVMSFEKA